MKKLKEIALLFVDTYKKWSDDRAMRMAAGLAYYALFSLAPLLVIVTGIVAALVERFFKDLVEQVDLTELFLDVLEPEVTQLIVDVVNSTTADQSATAGLPIVSIISIGILLWGASSIFKYLHEVLNTIWGVEAIVKGGILVTVRRYAVSFAIVLLLGLLLVLYLLLAVVVSSLLPVVERLIPDALEILPDFRVLQLSQSVILFLVVTLLFSIFYKILPDVEITWRDVFVGAAVTSLLFGIGVLLLSVYFTFYSNSLYGAASSLIVLLLWCYYSAQIFMFGAEFTYMYATRYGSKIRPADYVEEEDAHEEDEIAEAEQLTHSPKTR